eukprot:3626488-Pyramimonas_sp.AAC.1
MAASGLFRASGTSLFEVQDIVCGLVAEGERTHRLTSCSSPPVAGTIIETMVKLGVALANIKDMLAQAV